MFAEEHGSEVATHAVVDHLIKVGIVVGLIVVVIVIMMVLWKRAGRRPD